MMRLCELLLCLGLACVFIAAGVLALAGLNMPLISPLLACVGLTLVFVLDQLCSLSRAVSRQTDYVHSQYEHHQRQIPPNQLCSTPKQETAPPVVAEVMVEPPEDVPRVCREWNYKGRDPFNGTYVSHIGRNKIVIERTDGKQMAGDIRKFSDADQRWLSKWIED